MKVLRVLAVFTILLMIAVGCSAPVSQTTTQCQKLIFTVKGDDGSFGQASAYDVRWSYTVITAASFATATRFNTTKPPKAPGTIDTIVVTGLPSDTLLYFAVKTGDEQNNWSTLSNVISFRTPDITPPGPITDLTGTSCP